MTDRGVLASAGILTRKQLMEELKVSSETVAMWESEHDFPGRTAGRTTFYDVELIRKWIAAKPRG